MQVKVSYTTVHIAEVEITEEMIRELYDRFQNERFVSLKIIDAINDYIDKESGYIDNDGRDPECDTDIEEYVDKIVNKIIMEEEQTSSFFYVSVCPTDPSGLYHIFLFMSSKAATFYQ